MGLRDEVKALQESKRKKACQAIEVAGSFGKDESEWRELLEDDSVVPADLAAIAANHQVVVSESTVRNHRNRRCCCYGTA